MAELRRSKGWRIEIEECDGLSEENLRYVMKFGLVVSARVQLNIH